MVSLVMQPSEVIYACRVVSYYELFYLFPVINRLYLLTTLVSRYSLDDTDYLYLLS